VNCIAIPQNKKMENEYINGYELELEFIKQNNLELDEIFEVYVEEDKTKYINFTNKHFIELENYGIWDELNTIPNIFIGIELYESADIPNKFLKKVLEYLKEDKEGLSKEAKQVIEEMILLFEEAIEIGVGVYFFF